MKFFVDNNLSPQLANGMKAFGEDVIHITEIFPDNTDDTEYLPRIGSEYAGLSPQPGLSA